MRDFGFAGAGLVLGVLVCATAQGAAATMYGLPMLERDDFNRLARAANVPLFWNEDSVHPGMIDPAEVVVLGVGADRSQWIDEKGFTSAFEQAWKRLVEVRRREAVRKELDQGRPTLVRTDLSKASRDDRELVKHLVVAARRIDALYMKQLGADGLDKGLAPDDDASRALFHRNSGPWCEAAQTEKDPFCNGTPDFRPQRWGSYPIDEAQDAELCDRLKALPNGQELLAPFTVVRKVNGQYVARTLIEEYGPEMAAVAGDLRLAAKIAMGMKEKSLERYLLAAAKGFETNDWAAADEAWAAMNGSNSRWYLRVGPDEVYWDLCQEKAGFHLSFARIDPSALALQKQLSQVRDEMEQSVAALIGAPYKARKVSFQMPDFIEIVVNAGDSRSALGATIGQSLPNWGKVADEGRGRTVVMTNLYMDPDSKRLGREKAALLLTPETMAYYSDDPMPGLIDIILHEATHNLGPYSDYKVNGKGPGEIFGGKLASVLEELKAQTGALFYVPLLQKRGILTDESVKHLYVHALAWSFGHIAQGMFTASGNPKAYSQLAAVHIGTLMEEGALTWEVTTDPKTKRPMGRFAAHFDRFAPAMDRLMQKVGRAKATGDVAGAKALVDPFVTGDQKHLVHADEIAERLAAFPKASMVYAVEW